MTKVSKHVFRNFSKFRIKKERGDPPSVRRFRKELGKHYLRLILFKLVLIFNGEINISFKNEYLLQVQIAGLPRYRQIFANLEQYRQILAYLLKYRQIWYKNKFPYVKPTLR